MADPTIWVSLAFNMQRAREGIREFISGASRMGSEFGRESRHIERDADRVSKAIDKVGSSFDKITKKIERETRLVEERRMPKPRDTPGPDDGGSRGRGRRSRGGLLGSFWYDIGSLTIGRERTTDINRLLNITQRLSAGTGAFRAATAAISGTTAAFIALAAAADRALAAYDAATIPADRRRMAGRRERRIPHAGVPGEPAYDAGGYGFGARTEGYFGRRFAQLVALMPASPGSAEFGIRASLDEVNRRYERRGARINQAYVDQRALSNRPLREGEHRYDPVAGNYEGSYEQRRDMARLAGGREWLRFRAAEGDPDAIREIDRANAGIVRRMASGLRTQQMFNPLRLHTIARENQARVQAGNARVRALNEQSARRNLEQAQQGFGRLAPTLEIGTGEEYTFTRRAQQRRADQTQQKMLQQDAERNNLLRQMQGGAQQDIQVINF